MVNSPQWQLSPDVVLRPEAFGGMAFHRGHGTTLEIDDEAYQFLCSCVSPRSLPGPAHPAAMILPQLLRMGFLSPAREDVVDPSVPSAPPWLGKGEVLSIPETVHLVLTRRCNLTCPGCYAACPEKGPEWSLDELYRLIDEWAELRVFQLAIGGGEPLVYQGLFDVVSYAHSRGLVCNLTTNGTLLTQSTVDALETAGVKRVNVSINGPGDAVDSRLQAIEGGLRSLVASRIQAGVNLLVTPDVLCRIDDIFKQAVALGVQHVTLLRPKPPGILSDTNGTWFQESQLTQEHLAQLKDTLRKRRHAVRVEVDCTLVGLMDDIPAPLLRWRGIHGCTAGQRMCTVWPDGRVTPCSFLPLSGGNVRQRSFASVWAAPDHWEGLRPETTGACEGKDCASCYPCGVEI